MEVFRHWKTTHDHPKSKLDTKRRRRIEARISEGSSIEDLCLAITNAKNDDHLMGTTSGKKFDGIDTILRDAAQVERLIELTTRSRTQPRRNGATPIQPNADRTTEEFMASIGQHPAGVETNG